MAWQLSESGTTVLRAGFGIYHDHLLPYSYANFVSRQPPFYNSFSSGNVLPQFPNGYLNLTQGAVPSLTPFPTVIKEPTKNSYNVSLQRQLVKDMLLEVAYIGSQSHHLQGSGEQNTPVPTFVNGQPTFPASGPVVRANPNFSSVRYYGFNTNAKYNALQATLKRRSSSGLQYQASYTFSKSIDLKSILTNGDTRQSLGLTGFETFDILGLDASIRPRATLTVRATGRDGSKKEFKALARIDTPEEMNYYRNGGILPYVLRQLVSGR